MPPRPFEDYLILPLGQRLFEAGPVVVMWATDRDHGEKVLLGRIGQRLPEAGRVKIVLSG